jgi:hypothetical protein
MIKSLFRSAIVGLLAAAIAVSLGSLGYSQDASIGSLQGLREFLGPTIAVQKRHNDRLMAIPDVVGTAVGLTAEGQPAIKVYTKAAIAGIPDALDGVPVALWRACLFDLLRCYNAELSVSRGASPIFILTGWQPTGFRFSFRARAIRRTHRRDFSILADISRISSSWVIPSQQCPLPSP